MNLTIASATWIELLNEIQADEQYGLVKATETSPLVMIEYSSPNTNKPLHLGHVRNNLLGNALANIVAANGNKVVKTNIVNDRGIHICKSMLAWKKYGNGETPETSGKKGDHLVGDYYVIFNNKLKEEINTICISESWDELPDIIADNIKNNLRLIEDYKNRLIEAYYSLPFESIPFLTSEIEILAETAHDNGDWNGFFKELPEILNQDQLNDFLPFFEEIDYLQNQINDFESGIKSLVERNSPLMQEAREMLVKWEAGDPEVRGLWEMMNNWVYAGFDETYKKMGVGFDKIYYESNTYLEGKEKVMEGLEKGFFYKKEDGSVWADLTAEGLDHKLLLRGDGTSVYMTQDIGTAKLRFADYPINKMIYVVGNEQNYHFQVLSILLDKLGFEWGKSLVHFSYGMVELPEGKMKSREGTVVDADDLMEEMIATAKETSQELGKLDGLTQEEADDIARIVGLGALKYFILKVDARKNMTFNPKESIDFNGNTGPFIQYTYARIQSVLRKAAESGIVIPEQIPAGIELSEKEEGLIQMVADFAAVVKQAGEDYSPSIIANYTYDLVKEYNQFYHDYSILREENEAVKVFRIALSANVAKVVRLGMNLLGIEVPSRM